MSWSIAGYGPKTVLQPGTALRLFYSRVRLYWATWPYCTALLGHMALLYGSHTP